MLGGRFQGGALLRGRTAGLGVGLGLGLGLGGYQAMSTIYSQLLQTCQRPLAARTRVHVKEPARGDS